jgi:hypothetical protein
MRVVESRFSVLTTVVLMSLVLGMAGCSKSKPTVVVQQPSEPAAAPAVDKKAAAEEPFSIDPTDAEAMASIASEFDLVFPDMEKPETLRGTRKGAKIQVLYPRKDVRRDDLDQFRIDVIDTFEKKGAIEFRKGKEVLYTKPFEPERFETIEDIPAAVANAVEPGDKVTWGFYPEEGRPVTAVFKVVKESKKVTKRVGELEQRLAKNHPMVFASLKAQVFLDNRLHYAAYRESVEVLRYLDSPEVCAIAQASLRGMGLKKTSLWDDVQGRAGIRGYRGRYGSGPRR